MTPLKTFKNIVSAKDILIGGGLTLFSNMLIISFVFTMECSRGLTFLLLLISFFITVFLLGFWVKTAQININAKEWTLPKWKDKNLIKSGLKAFCSMVLFFSALYAVLIAFAMIVMFLVLLITLSFFSISDSTSQGLGWLFVGIILMFICWFVYPYLIITSSVTISSFVKDEKVTAPLKFRQNFRIFKNNPKETIKISLLMLIVSILMVLGNIFFPFIGFYFAIVLAKITAEIMNKFLQ